MCDFHGCIFGTLKRTYLLSTYYWLSAFSIRKVFQMPTTGQQLLRQFSIWKYFQFPFILYRSVKVNQTNPKCTNYMWTVQLIFTKEYSCHNKHPSKETENHQQPRSHTLFQSFTPVPFYGLSFTIELCSSIYKTVKTLLCQIFLFPNYKLPNVHIIWSCQMIKSQKNAWRLLRLLFLSWTRSQNTEGEAGGWRTERELSGGWG